MPPPPPPPPPGPPPPPASSGPPKLAKNDEKGRSALLTDICKGARLKSAGHLMVDKSKPLLGSEGKSSSGLGANKFGTVTPGTSGRRTTPNFGSVSSLNSELLQKISSRLPTDSITNHGNRLSSQGDKKYVDHTRQCLDFEKELKYLREPQNQLYAHSKSRASNVDIPTCGGIADPRRSSMFSTSFDAGDPLAMSGSCKQLASGVGSESCKNKDEKLLHRSCSFMQKPLFPPPPPPIVTRPAPRPEDDGGPNSSSTATVGAAAGRGGRSAGPGNLAGLFAGGMPRLRGATSTAPQDHPIQNGFRGNTSMPARSVVAPRPPRPSFPSMSSSTPTSPPPPPPPSAGGSRPFFNNHDNQESLTGRGANGRLSGFGMPLPPAPPSAQPSSNNRPPPPSRAASNRAPPPPPPSRGPPSTPSFDKPKPPAPMAPRAVPPPVPKPFPGSAPPPPPPARNTVAPSHAPSHDLPPPPNRSPRPPVPPMPSYVPQKSISSSFESKHNFRTDLPTAPGNFRKTPKSYPSAAPKNSSRSNNSVSRPTPPPPPM